VHWQYSQGFVGDVQVESIGFSDVVPLKVTRHTGRGTVENQIQTDHTEWNMTLRFLHIVDSAAQIQQFFTPAY